MPDYKPLNQQQRLDARRRAITAVETLAGAAPRRENFRHSSQSKYPGWLVWLIVILALVVMVCSFALSSMRLYEIGRATFAASIDQPAAATIAGLAIVILSEAAAVLFTIAYSVLGGSVAQRRILALSVAATAALALSGNYYVALHDHAVTVFAVLEAMLPPLLTLSTAYVLKALMLDEIAARHADELAYQRARDDWKIATSNPEDHPRYAQMYANELWDALVKSNRREAVREWFAQLDGSQRSQLVGREMKADNWLESGLTEDTASVLPVYQEVEADPFLAGAGKNGNALHG